MELNGASRRYGTALKYAAQVDAIACRESRWRKILISDIVISAGNVQPTIFDIQGAQIRQSRASMTGVL